MADDVVSLYEAAMPVACHKYLIRFSKHSLSF
jgi:hypothetical protein